MFTRRRGDTELASAQCRHRGRRPCSEWGSNRPVVVQNRQSNFPCFLTGRGRRAELADDAEVVPPAAGNADIETMSLQQKCSLCFVPSVYPRLISFATLTAGLRSICALSCFVSPQVSPLKSVPSLAQRAPSSVTLRFAQGKPSVYHLRTVVLRQPSPPLNMSGDTDSALFDGDSRWRPWRPSQTPSVGR